MATASFDKKIIIENDKAAEVLIKGLSKPAENINPPKRIDIENEAERGRLLLKRLYCR